MSESEREDGELSEGDSQMGDHRASMSKTKKSAKHNFDRQQRDLVPKHNKRPTQAQTHGHLNGIATVPTSAELISLEESAKRFVLLLKKYDYDLSQLAPQGLNPHHLRELYRKVGLGSATPTQSSTVGQHAVTTVTPSTRSVSAVAPRVQSTIGDVLPDKPTTMAAPRAHSSPTTSSPTLVVTTAASNEPDSMSQRGPLSSAGASPPSAAGPTSTTNKAGTPSSNLDLVEVNSSSMIMTMSMPTETQFSSTTTSFAPQSLAAAPTRSQPQHAVSTTPLPVDRNEYIARLMAAKSKKSMTSAPSFQSPTISNPSTIPVLSPSTVTPVIATPALPSITVNPVQESLATVLQASPSAVQRSTSRTSSADNAQGETQTKSPAMQQPLYVTHKTVPTHPSARISCQLAENPVGNVQSRTISSVAFGKEGLLSTEDHIVQLHPNKSTDAERRRAKTELARQRIEALTAARTRKDANAGALPSLSTPNILTDEPSNVGPQSSSSINGAAADINAFTPAIPPSSIIPGLSTASPLAEAVSTKLPEISTSNAVALSSAMLPSSSNIRKRPVAADYDDAYPQYANKRPFGRYPDTEDETPCIIEASDDEDDNDDDDDNDDHGESYSTSNADMDEASSESSDRDPQRFVRHGDINAHTALDKPLSQSGTWNRTRKHRLPASLTDNKEKPQPEAKKLRDKEDEIENIKRKIIELEMKRKRRMLSSRDVTPSETTTRRLREETSTTIMEDGHTDTSGRAVLAESHAPDNTSTQVVDSGVTISTSDKVETPQLMTRSNSTSQEPRMAPSFEYQLHNSVQARLPVGSRSPEFVPVNASTIPNDFADGTSSIGESQDSSSSERNSELATSMSISSSDAGTSSSVNGPSAIAQQQHLPGSTYAKIVVDAPPEDVPSGVQVPIEHAFARKSPPKSAILKRFISNEDVGTMSESEPQSRASSPIVYQISEIAFDNNERAAVVEIEIARPHDVANTSLDTVNGGSPRSRHSSADIDMEDIYGSSDEVTTVAGGVIRQPVELHSSTDLPQSTVEVNHDTSISDNEHDDIPMYLDKHHVVLEASLKPHPTSKSARKQTPASIPIDDDDEDYEPPDVGFSETSLAADSENRVNHDIVEHAMLQNVIDGQIHEEVLANDSYTTKNSSSTETMADVSPADEEASTVRLR